MKFLRIFLALVTLVAAATLVSHAQYAAGETHAHEAPHGGVVRSASPYHLELVLQPTSLGLYLLGAQMSAVPNKGTTGSVMVQTADLKTTTVTLAPTGDDHFSARLPTGAQVRTAIVTLNANGKTINVRFDKLDEAAAESQAVGPLYACPMHRKITSTEPGKCSKCGMRLKKKS